MIHHIKLNNQKERAFHKTSFNAHVEIIMKKRKEIDVKNLKKEVEQLFDVLNNESDLACILIGTNFVDVCLLEILKLNLKKSEVTKHLLNTGFLESLKNRADLCYCLNFINKELYQEICNILEIRNIVAHSHILEVFMNKDIIESCDKLVYYNSLKKVKRWQEMGCRDKFIISTAIISNFLISKISVDSKKLKENAS
jgi:DNA-binding MltR family transcriptional regulator